ncbi:peptidase C39, partial [Neisseria meningitidis]
MQSWKERRDFNIVKQDLDFSCGAASVATLLNNFYGQTLTEEEVLKKLDKEQMR